MHLKFDFSCSSGHLQPQEGNTMKKLEFRWQKLGYWNWISKRIFSIWTKAVGVGSELSFLIGHSRSLLYNSFLLLNLPNLTIKPLGLASPLVVSQLVRLDNAWDERLEIGAGRYDQITRSGPIWPDYDQIPVFDAGHLNDVFTTKPSIRSSGAKMKKGIQFSIIYFKFKIFSRRNYILLSFEFNLRIEGIYMEFHVYQVQFMKHSIASSGCSLVIVVEPGKLLPPAIYLVWRLKLQDSFKNQSNWLTNLLQLWLVFIIHFARLVSVSAK